MSASIFDVCFPLGIDLVEPPMLFALGHEGIEVYDGQQIMLDAREVKNPEAIRFYPAEELQLANRY